MGARASGGGVAEGDGDVAWEQVLAPFVIGGVDWRDTTRLGTNNPARQASRAVGLLRLPTNGFRCTAFLVAPDVVMTNHHCASGPEEARDAAVTFDHEAGTSVEEREWFRCATFLGADDALDFALLRCESVDGHRPGERHGVVQLTDQVPDPGAPLYMIHQNCDYFSEPDCDYTKKYSPGIELALDGSRLLHTCDGLGGSSGAPVFDHASHRVVALHRGGYGDPETGRGEHNQATLARDVLAAIESDFPGVLGDGRGADGSIGVLPPPAVPGAVRTWAMQWESSHPYAREVDIRRTFRVPGASRVRVHFARLDTEAGYDVVSVSGAGARERHSGALGELTTGWFYGDEVTVRLQSDESVDGWGFLLDAVDWVP
jgi:hypothetical protein